MKLLLTYPELITRVFLTQKDLIFIRFSLYFIKIINTYSPQNHYRK